MPLSINRTGDSDVPLEVEGIIPSETRERSLAEIEKLDIFQGNRKVPLAEFFSVSGDPSDGEICWLGDNSGVHWIGAKMSEGTVHVAGNAGRHVGSEMRGGRIQVDGDAGDWVGGEMKKGMIHVRGNAGHLIGAAYRGSPRGMGGGTILIDGDVGNEIGHTMRRGLVAVGGSCGDLAGFNMLAGSIFVFGGCGIRHGAGMRRGTIGFFGETLPHLLPSFAYACRFRPPIMQLIFQQLKSDGFQVPEHLSDASFDLYNGDLIEGGRGEILLVA